MLDPHTLAFADFRGNKQFISQGNLTENPKVLNGMMDIYKTWIKDFGVDGYRVAKKAYVTTSHSAILVLESLAHAQARHAQSPGQLDPSSATCTRSMRPALSRSCSVFARSSYRPRMK